MEMHIQAHMIPDSEMHSSLTHLLFSLYNHDILEEEVIVTWYTMYVNDSSLEGSAIIQERLSGFVTWLKEAEEEEEEEDG